jgi:hypothetical protein
MVDGEVLSFVVAHTDQLSAVSGDEDAFAQKGLFGNFTLFRRWILNAECLESSFRIRQDKYPRPREAPTSSLMASFAGSS